MSDEDMEWVLKFYEDDGDGNLERRVNEEALDERDKALIEAIFSKYNRQ